jgi:hypothetical protein
MQDGNRCAQRFIDEMNHEQPDFIISLSDFCVPKGGHSTPFLQKLTLVN